MVQQLPWSAPGGSRPPAANRPRAADKMRCSSALRPTPRPCYARAMCGGCVSWLTLCEKKIGGSRCRGLRVVR